MLSHGKLDRSFFFMAGLKSPRKIIYRVLGKYVYLVAPTYASPKVNVAAFYLLHTDRLHPNCMEISYPPYVTET